MKPEPLDLDFRAVDEPLAGAKWQTLFEEFWPAYRQWFVREGDAARPGRAETLGMLRHHMPELIPTYERLVALAGGGIRPRFLGLYRPTPFLAGCTHAVLTRGDPVMIRNYDYAPRLCDGVVLRSVWSGTAVIASVDCLWGVLDGMNEHGLAVALAFGGRPVVGDGFAITLILRYVLEACATAEQARAVLSRVPSYMAYNVTVLDAGGAHFTAFLSPDRPTIIESTGVCANHQGRVEWPKHARMSATIEREAFVRARIEIPEATLEGVIESFLRPPIYRRDYRHGGGTLYTSVYRPAQGAVQLVWPEHRWCLGFDEFDEHVYVASYDVDDDVAHSRR